MINFIKSRTDLSVDENVVFLSVISVFLPYYLSIIVLVVLSLYVILKTDIRKTVFSHMGAMLVPIFSAITFITAIYYKNTLGIFCSLLFFFLLVLSFYLRTIMTTALFEKALDLICVSSVFTALVTLIEKLIFMGDKNHRCYGDFLGNMYTSFYFHPNYVGSLLATVILICAYKVVVKRNDKKYYYAISILAATGIFFTGSMFAWIEVLVGLSILLMLSHRHQLLGVMFISIALFGVIIYAAPEIIEKLLPRITHADGTFNNRVLIWDFTIEAIKKTPLFGRGFFTYFQLSQAVKSAYQTTHAHNIFLEPLLSFGIIGSLLLFAMIFILFYRIFLCKNLLRKSRISALIISIAAAILIHSIIDMTILWPQTALLYCIIVSGIGADEQKIRKIFKDHFKKSGKTI